MFSRSRAAAERSPRPLRPRPDEATIASRRLARTNLARGALASVPVVLVNSTAFIGQFAFIRQHVPWILPGQVLFAVALESVAIYLAWHAHIAAMANDSATRLKLGAYSFALIVGGMNYSHYMARDWHPTVMAVGMFFMSALSPWLWGIHTRRASRDKLMALGLLEEHAVRLGATRWTWHPFRSMRVMSWSTWHGVNDPKRAIAHFEARWGTADTPEPARASRATRKAVPARLVPVLEAVPDAGTIEAAQAAGTLPTPKAAQARVPKAPVPAQAPGANDEPAAQLGAAAHLEATAKLSPGSRPSQEVLDDVELRLAAMQLDELPSEREVARQLGHPTNYRRLAKTLLAARRTAGTSLSAAPSSERVAGNGAGQRRDPSVIATPISFQPGGSQAND